VDELGGVSRLDTYFFSYKFESDTLLHKAQSIIGVCIVQSSAQIAKLDPNTCRVLVTQCFGDSSLETRKIILNELEDMVEEANTRNWVSTSPQPVIGRGKKSGGNANHDGTGLKHGA
jgi:hypothetical protein